MYGEILRLLEKDAGLTILYNGPKCGASAPDHAHLQAVSTGILPLQKNWQRLSRHLVEVVKKEEDSGIWFVADYPIAAFLVRGNSQESHERLFKSLYACLPQREDETEPMMNIIAWRQGDTMLSVVLPRRQHRPACYTAEGEEQYIISPGAVDMGGLLITPREEDFRKITPEVAHRIYQEVSLTSEQVQEVMDKLKNYSFGNPYDISCL